MRFAIVMIFGLVAVFGGYITYGHSDVAIKERLAQGVHNLWHPDYP